MKRLSLSPIELKDFAVSELCQDLFDIGTGKSKGFDRVDALGAVLGANPASRASHGASKLSPPFGDYPGEGRSA